MARGWSVLGLVTVAASIMVGLLFPDRAYPISHHRREQLRHLYGHRKGITAFPNNGFLHPTKPFPITGPYPYVGGYNRVRAYKYDRSYDPDSYLGRRNRFLMPVR